MKHNAIKVVVSTIGALAAIATIDEYFFASELKETLHINASLPIWLPMYRAALLACAIVLSVILSELISNRRSYVNEWRSQFAYAGLGRDFSARLASQDRQMDQPYVELTRIVREPRSIGVDPESPHFRKMDFSAYLRDEFFSRPQKSKFRGVLLQAASAVGKTRFLIEFVKRELGDLYILEPLHGYTHLSVPEDIVNQDALVFLDDLNFYLPRIEDVKRLIQVLTHRDAQTWIFATLR